MISDQAGTQAFEDAAKQQRPREEMTGVAADDLESVVDEVVRLGRYRQLRAEDGLHLAAALSHRLMLSISALERAGCPGDRILEQVAPARAIHAESPFIRRLQEWPRGYPGDFETVEYLVEQRNRALPGRLSYWLEQYALDSSIAQQHRNKVDLQARAILEAVQSASLRTGEPRILILAAGGSPDLRQIQSVLAPHTFRAVLVDQDPDALAFSSERLPLVRDRLTLVKRSIVRGIQEAQRHGPYQLVLAGGLFDYLPDKVAVLVLRHAKERLLEPGGRFVFTNIGRPNVYRQWIEYLAEWRLIHRSETEVRDLCVQASFQDTDVSVTQERTGLALIVSCLAGAGDTGRTFVQDATERIVPAGVSLQ